MTTSLHNRPLPRRACLLCLVGIWPGESIGWASQDEPKSPQSPTPSSAQAPPSAGQYRPWTAQLALEWPNHQSPNDYAVSEKWDGVRALWDGQRLCTRNGHKLHAPEAWLSQLPHMALDGELVLSRGRFEAVSGLVRRLPQTGGDSVSWAGVRYLVFDAPTLPGTFAQRHQELKTRLQAQSPQTPVQLVQQHRVGNQAQLQQQLQSVVAQGGEGLVLHRWQALWQPGRSGAVYKLKPWSDAEGEVVAYVLGHGRLQTLVGALVLRLATGQTVRLGSGLSDALRRNPPELGTWVSFTHQGLTAQGVPRFPTYWRVRPRE